METHSALVHLKIAIWGFDMNVKDSTTPNLHKADGPMISVTYKGGIFGILPNADFTVWAL